MPTKDEKRAKAKRFEDKYAEISRFARVPMPIPAPPYRDNLEQPSALRVVETRTTYGAYEEPI